MRMSLIQTRQLALGNFYGEYDGIFRRSGRLECWAQMYFRRLLASSVVSII